MEEIKCPHCGSKYVAIKESSGDFAGAAKKCWCQACGQTFAVNAPTVGSRDTLLMSFYDSATLPQYARTQASIYRTAAGYKVIQRKGDKQYEFEGTPRLKLVQLPISGDECWGLQYNGFRSRNDPMGVLFFVEAFKLSPELDRLAEGNEAMQIAKRQAKDEGFYSVHRLKTQTILQDIQAWLLPHLQQGSQGPQLQTAKKGCYLTSACTRSRGLPDDCYELQRLRWFRDNFLANQPGGEADIQEYYRIAPQIVAAIDRAEQPDKRWNAIYEELIAPCVRLIDTHQLTACFDLYKQYTRKLQAAYLG